MGLSLEVGILADLKTADPEGYKYFVDQFETVNKALRAEGLPAHSEPEELREIFSCDMFGYSGLHYLRRIAAYLALGHELPPPGDSDAASDPILDSEYEKRFLNGEMLRYQHLIIHSDAEGFYLPIDFEVPLIVTEFQVVGGMFGSTQRLEKECAELAKLLQIPEGVDHEADMFWEAADSQGEGADSPGGDLWQRYGVETFTCTRLLAACRASLANRAAITFC